MKDPLLIDLVGTDTNQIPDTITNAVVLVSDINQKNSQLANFIANHRDKKMLIFTETKKEARDFENKKFGNFIALHGDLSQSARQHVLNNFRRPNCRSILVATDVAARGLDIDNIDVIVQYSVRNVDAFVHRAGRTGRAGKDGLNIVFAEKENIDFLKQVEDNLNINLNYINNIGIFKKSSESTEKIEQEKKNY